jgi:hypothetical protein
MFHEKGREIADRLAAADSIREIEALVEVHAPVTVLANLFPTRAIRAG